MNDCSTTETYTLSLHDALPIYGKRPLDAPDREDGGPGHGCHGRKAGGVARGGPIGGTTAPARRTGPDRKSTRLNSSHPSISYAVFCLKKKITTHSSHPTRLPHP